MSRSFTTWSLASTIFLIGAGLIGMSLPPLLGKVPPNRLYGFRTAKTLSDPTLWYSANAFAAKAGIIAGLVMVPLGVALVWLARNKALSGIQISVIGLTFEILPPASLALALFVFNLRL